MWRETKQVPCAAQAARFVQWFMFKVVAAYEIRVQTHMSKKGWGKVSGTQQTRTDSRGVFTADIIDDRKCRSNRYGGHACVEHRFEGATPPLLLPQTHLRPEQSTGIAT